MTEPSDIKSTPPPTQDCCWNCRHYIRHTDPEASEWGFGYSCTVDRDIRDMPIRGIPFTEDEPMDPDGSCDRFKRSICKLHGSKLIQGLAKVDYGIYAPTEEYLRAWNSLFPYSKLRIRGGGFYSEDFPKEKIVNYCPACREAENEWKPFSETFD